MGWGYNVRRQMKIFTLTMTIYLDYKAVQRKVKWMPQDRKDKLWEITHERNAKRLLKAIIELEGLWVKLGQYLSTRADVLPEAYVNHLKQLQDSLPPRPLEEVHHTIEKELGKLLKDLFDDFDNVPLATASISQVHRAHTVDGLDVVVKVQHKGIKNVILQDLKNAKLIVDWIAWAEPQFNFGPVLNEWCAEVPKELDFNLEAENTRRVSKNLNHDGKTGDDLLINRVDVLVPEVIQSTEKVLLLQYMDGVRLSDVAALDELGVDKQTLVETITRSYAHQIYVDGFFNGDPHPGNFLVSKTPPHQPILLDFGLTKDLSTTMKQGLAKMLLAAAEGDHAALLSAFAEMGLTLRLDMPEDAMEITNYFFRRAIPAKESVEDFKVHSKEAEQRMKRLQERMKQENSSRSKKSSHRNPVDAFPGDAIFFMRVLNLLRGLSSMLGARVVYVDIMRPFAETALWSEPSFKCGSSLNASSWIHGSRVHSEVENKLQRLLLDLGQQNKILGIQVCAYHNGEVIIDTAAGYLGKYDPRPVQHDSLFPVFSATKGVTAGLVHWLIDQGIVRLHDRVSMVWPEFSVHGKEDCTVAHVLNHTAGLHNALSNQFKEDPFIMCKWEDVLKELADAVPDAPPGTKQAYHALTYGWLCGGIIEKASGKKFQELLEEVLVRKLGVDGEFYVGIPPGVESRLASLTLDMAEFESAKSLFKNGIGDGGTQNHANVSAILGENAAEDFFSVIAAMPVLFNMLFIRRAVIPAANGHFSARALARYYAMLVNGGEVPLHSSSSEPLLGSHPLIPVFSPKDENTRSRKGRKEESVEKQQSRRYLDKSTVHHNGVSNVEHRIFKNPNIHDSFLGTGDYDGLAQVGPFGLGFRRYSQVASGSPQYFAFGHSGVGGSTAFCYPGHNFALAITVNKMSRGGVTATIIKFICSELNLPCPEEYLDHGGMGPDMKLDMSTLNTNVTH
ncbi:hypothetical protein GOP47_0002562 [Adiantum capillus-veneris]|uniref:Uncharacterized protein n=1 Tax=Adiantum capillus-veneris TaxID=13818 RepID=A0A9D4VB49_ADICA|nr:hypothetical protein GOP47_0002562 [Adiantum capillus-veneris]